VNGSPDILVRPFALPASDQSGNQVEERQQSQNQPGEEGHETRVRLLKRAESQPEPAVAHHGCEPDPYEIIYEKRFLQNRPWKRMELIRQTNSEPGFFATPHPFGCNLPEYRSGRRAGPERKEVE
jgi:hypothetical protein